MGPRRHCLPVCNKKFFVSVMLLLLLNAAAHAKIDKKVLSEIIYL